LRWFFPIVIVLSFLLAERSLNVLAAENHLDAALLERAVGEPYSGGAGVPPALGQAKTLLCQNMPKPAPPINRQSTQTGSPTDDSQGLSFTRSVVRVKPNNNEPLNGQVSRWDQNATTRGDYLHGNVDTMVRTSPALFAAVTRNVPPEMFRAWLEKSHPRFALSASTMAQSNLLEVKGHWDDSSRTLRALGIPYTRIGAGELRDIPLDRAKLMIIDCAGNVPRESLQRIRDFVARGGYLLTTDWALNNVLERAFPGYVAWDKKINKKSVYDAAVENPDPVLFRYTVTNAHWKMDDGCHLLKVVKPSAVRVLARSTQLAAEDRYGDGALAVMFSFGKGYVMHLVGHFDNNTNLVFRDELADPAPVIGISLRQAIASNFVVAGLTGESIPSPAGNVSRF
jgi:hypothetical protein